MPRLWSGGGPVCHQCVTVPGHCQVLRCTWDSTQLWQPESSGWAQGADSSPGAQGGTAHHSAHSSTTLLRHGLLGAGGGFVSQQSPSVVGSWWVPGPSCSCRVFSAPSSWTVPPWCLMASAEMGTMPPPASATCPQGCLAGQHGCHCRAVGKPSGIPVCNMCCHPPVRARVSLGTESVRPLFSLPLCPL